MTTQSFCLYALAAVTSAAGLTAGEPNTTGTETTIAVEAGTAAFISNTNISAISVKGKSTAMQGRVRVGHSPEGLRLEHIEAWVPVKSIATGMGVRDEHMRRYIFTTPDGKTPDVRFEAQQASCGKSGKESTCQIAGNLSIRGVARPFTMPLRVREDGSAFRAAGDAVVKLSDYGIERPTQLGVTAENEVKLHFEFTAKQAPATTASAGGGQ